MRFHPGVEPEKAMFGYMQAMQGFSIEAIAAGIQKFLRGECDGVNPRYCPHPPELAQIVRTAVVPSRIPAERQVPKFEPPPLPNARLRMRLKFPMWRAAVGSKERMDELAVANAEGFAAMVALAAKWGVPVPDEFNDIPEEELERQWHQARRIVLAEIERNPPPYLRHKK